VCVCVFERVMVRRRNIEIIEKGSSGEEKACAYHETHIKKFHKPPSRTQFSNKSFSYFSALCMQPQYIHIKYFLLKGFCCCLY
jgi:hypothetical protein